MRPNKSNMTTEEQISALKDEVEKLKTDLVAERKNSDKLTKAVDNKAKKVTELEATIKTKDETIQALASADPAPAAKQSTAALQFKHKDELYQLDENPERHVIIPGMGSIKAAEAIKNAEAVAYLVSKEIATKL